MKQLISFEEHNRKALDRYAVSATGISCDKCGEELHYAEGIALMRQPPQREVHCISCGNKTRIII